jgi:Domain of unknown function (DUF1707)
MTGPGDEISAGAASRSMRSSHGDREQVIEVLKAAFVHGRLDKDEFDLRVGRVLASRTYADLAALTADIPAQLTTARSLQPASEPASKKKKAAAALACATLALLAGVVVVPPLPDGSPAELSVIAAIFVLFGIVGIGWFLLLHAWLEERAGRQSTQGLPPGDGGEASRRLAQANPARKVPQVDRDPRQAAKASPIRRLRPALPSWRTPNRGRPRQYAVS